MCLNLYPLLALLLPTSFYGTAIHIRHQEHIHEEVRYYTQIINVAWFIIHLGFGSQLPGTIKYLLLHTSTSRALLQNSRSDWINRMEKILFLYNTVSQRICKFGKNLDTNTEPQLLTTKYFNFRSHHCSALCSVTRVFYT